MEKFVQLQCQPTFINYLEHYTTGKLAAGGYIVDILSMVCGEFTDGDTLRPFSRLQVAGELYFAVQSDIMSSILSVVKATSK